MKATASVVLKPLRPKRPRSRHQQFPLPLLERRSFFKVGIGAYVSMMAGCASLTRTVDPRTMLLKGEREWKPSVCTLCPSGCAIRVYSEGERIVAVGGDPDDPNTGGKMCPIGLSILNLHNNPDRLTGAFRKSADGKMTPVRVEEILEPIASRIRNGGTLHIYGRITPFASQLAKTLKALCHRDPESDKIFDSGFLNTDGRPPVFDFENARIALLFDANILEHGYPLVGYLRRTTEARQRGLRFITLSPFLTNTATAGEWIPIRSRTAAWPASLAIAQQACNDPSLHVAAPSSDIADLLRSLDGKFLERVSGLSRTAIEEIARRFFNEPGPAISDRPDASVILLNILKGNLNRAGGLLHPGQRALKVEADSADLGEILRDSRNVVLLHQSNPAYSMASGIRPILQSSGKAMVVSVDSFMSETAALSDFVLPLASPLETLTITEPLPLGNPFLAAAPAAAKPNSACRSFDDWLTRLATVIAGAVPPLTPEGFAAASIAGNSSVNLAADRAIYRIPSSDRKLEADMPSIISSLKTAISALPSLSALRQDQCLLATFEESVQGPATAPSKWLDEITYSPKIYLNPVRAARLGIRSGDSVILTDSRGASLEGIALLFEGVHPDALAIPLHHGHTGFGRVARGESFPDSADPDMSRMFWGKNRGPNPAEFSGGIVTIQRRRG